MCMIVRRTERTPPGVDEWCVSNSQALQVMHFGIRAIRANALIWTSGWITCRCQAYLPTSSGLPQWSLRMSLREELEGVAASGSVPSITCIPFAQFKHSMYGNVWHFIDPLFPEYVPCTPWDWNICRPIDPQTSSMDRHIYIYGSPM